jgi:hypothetical protein
VVDSEAAGAGVKLYRPAHGFGPPTPDKQSHAPPRHCLKVGKRQVSFTPGFSPVLAVIDQKTVSTVSRLTREGTSSGSTAQRSVKKKNR